MKGELPRADLNKEDSGGDTGEGTWTRICLMQRERERFRGRLTREQKKTEERKHRAGGRVLGKRY